MPEFCVYREGKANVTEMWVVEATSQEEAIKVYKTKGIKDPQVEVDYDDFEVFAEEV
jgi:hypothetical protein